MRRVLLLTLALLLSGCTSSGEGTPDDQDGDGLRDDIESKPHAITITLENGTITRLVTSDTTKVDTDGDLLPDVDEFLRGTDPTDVDTDADGLLDGDSLTPTHSPTITEWRRRGIAESPPGTFLGELSMCEATGGLKPTSWSSDRPFADGLGDAEELSGWDIVVRGQPTHVISSECTRDGDEDGLPDDVERDLKTHPRVADTDGDGTKDGIDADPLWDLGLEIRALNATSGNGTRLILTLGFLEEEAVVPPAWHKVPIPVSDQSPGRGSLLAIGSLGAVNATGAPLALTAGGAQAILRFDLIAGTLETDGHVFPEGNVTLTGDAGSVSFAWGVTRT